MTTESEPHASTGRPTFVRYQVLGLLTLSAAIAYLTRNAVGVAESTIREEVGLTIEQSGWFMGTFFWSYALLQIPGGWLAHNRGPKFALLACTCCGAVATLCIGLAPALWLLLAAQLVMGAAQAGLFPAAAYTVSHWIPLPRRSFSCGLLAMGMQVGAIASGMLTGELIEHIPWRSVFFAYALPGFLWAFVFFLRFQNDPRKHPSVNDDELRLINPALTDEDNDERTTATPWLAIARTPAIWFLCTQQMCRAAGSMFFASWFPTFLQKMHGVSVEGSGYRQALVFGGTTAGSLLGGWLTDRIWQKTQNLRVSRSGVGAIALLCCSLLILGAWFVDSSNVAIGLLAAAAFFGALAGPCAYSATMDLGGQHVAPVFGLMNMMGNLAAASCPILVGTLFTRTDNWTLVLVIFAGLYFVGAIAWALVDCNRSVEEK